MERDDESYFGTWFGGGKPCNVAVFVPFGDLPYLAFFMLELEEEREQKMGLWPALVEELKVNDVNLDKASKAVCKKLGIARLDTNVLMIYRWSKQYLQTDLNEQLSFLFLQKFFRYFLTRPHPDARHGYYYKVQNDLVFYISFHFSGRVADGVSPKLFQGMVNSRYLSSIQSAVSNATSNLEGNISSTSSSLDQERLLLMKAYSTWLEDPVVLSGCLHAPSMPPIFIAKKLTQLIAGDAVSKEFLMPFILRILWTTIARSIGGH